MGDLAFSLLKWQRELFQDKTRFQVVVAGRRCGKSRYAVVRTIVKALECPDPTGAVIYVAPTQKMARVLCWNLLNDLARPVITKVNITDAEVTLINGVTIYVRGADNPDNLRGMKLYYAVLDESKDFKDDVWPLIIRPALSDMKGGALMIGTPEPGESQFRECYELGVSGTDPDWMGIHLTTYDNELIDKDEIEAAKRSMSTAAFEQEYMASFDTAGQNVLKLEWLKYNASPPARGDTYIAVDLAGFEAVNSQTPRKKHLDFTAIAVVTVDDNGVWFVRKIDYGRWDVREAAVRILLAIKNHKPLCVGIEKGSLMRALLPYLTDLMRKNNLYAHIEAIPTSGSSKVNRITYGIQGLLEHGRIILNERENWDELKREMIAFPTTKAHDDLIDALSMCAHLVTVIYGAPDDSGDFTPMDDICGF